MGTGVRLTLRAADKIASGAVQTALRNSFKPITATVLDASGNVRRPARARTEAPRRPHLPFLSALPTSAPRQSPADRQPQAALEIANMH
jgi:uncharacterized protein GlcG (DUF336 family)